jgi:hypothetical protein
MVVRRSRAVIGTGLAKQENGKREELLDIRCSWIWRENQADISRATALVIPLAVAYGF